MKLPRYTAKISPVEPSLARATDIGALTRTGEAAKWRGVGAAGGALGRISEALLKVRQTRKKLDDDIRWGEGTQKTEEVAAELGNAADIYNFTVDEPLPGSPDYYKTPLLLSVEKKEKLIDDALAIFDKRTSEIAQSFPTEEGRRRYESWRNGRRLLAEAALKKAYGDKHHEFQIARLDKLRIDAAKNGNEEAADSYTDTMDKHELITPIEAERRKRENKELVYESMKEDVLNTAFNLLSVRGVEATIAWINKKENTPDLLPQHRFQIVGYIKQQAELDEYRDYEADKQQLSESVDGIVELFLDNQHIGKAVDALTSAELKGRWNKIAAGQGSIVEKTDSKKYIDLEEKVLDFWRGRIDATELKTQLLEARAVDKSITDKDLQLLLKRAAATPDPNVLGLYEHGFETIRRRGAATWADKGWSWWLSKKAEAALLSDKEAETIASARQALITWLEDHKDATPEEVYKQSLALVTAHRKDIPIPKPEEKPPTGVKEPITQEEFLTQLRTMTREEKDPNKPKSRAYYNKWMEKFPWTYWGP